MEGYSSPVSCPQVVARRGGGNPPNCRCHLAICTNININKYHHGHTSPLPGSNFQQMFRDWSTYTLLIINAETCYTFINAELLRPHFWYSSVTIWSVVVVRVWEDGRCPLWLVLILNYSKLWKHNKSSDYFPSQYFHKHRHGASTLLLETQSRHTTTGLYNMRQLGNLLKQRVWDLSVLDQTKSYLHLVLPYFGL